MKFNSYKKFLKIENGKKWKNLLELRIIEFRVRSPKFIITVSFITEVYAVKVQLIVLSHVFPELEINISKLFTLRKNQEQFL